MGINPAAIFKIKGAWEKFSANHPKFPLFLNAAAKSGIKEGYILELKVTSDTGETICTNVKLTEADMELIQTLKELGAR